MSQARKERWAVRSAKADYLRRNETGRTMLDYAAAWLATLPSFEGSSIDLREAVVVDLRSRDRCEFTVFGNRDDGGGICLVDETDRQLSLATLTRARMRARLKGALSHG